MKKIISKYISSENELFIEEYLLNNLIVNFYSKYRILQYIIRDLELTVDRDFDKGMKILMQIRNAVAHSDRLDKIDVVGAEYEDGHAISPIYGLDPEAMFIEMGDVKVERLEKKIDHFYKYLNIVDKELDKILLGIE